MIAWRNRVIGDPGFQAWAARFPLTRGIARRDGARLFDLVAGFVYSQVLTAVVELDVIGALRHGPRTTADLARHTGVPPERMDRLAQAAAGLGLLQRSGDAWTLARLGAALPAVPGLTEMIRHHAVLYGDLARPGAFFRGETDPDLARVWPYVFGPGAAEDPETAARYSRLMAETQGLVAAEVLDAVDLRDVGVLMDVGGGTGAFLRAALARGPDLSGVLVDLPAVLAAAPPHPRIRPVPGDFRTGPLPAGADAISLIRVLYDHTDAIVRALLAAVRAALPPGGRLIVAEPMGGGDRPDRFGDGYYAIYCLAMGTGRVRSGDEIAALLSETGFAAVRVHATRRPYLTGLVTARVPEPVSDD